MRLLHGANGRLHQRDRGLQVVAVPTNESSHVLEFVVLFLRDLPHQLQLPLLQDAHQAVEAVAQLLPLSLAVLLR